MGSLVHKYVALRKLHVRFPDGTEGDVQAGDMVPAEVSESWSESAIRSMLNVKRIDFAGVDQRSVAQPQPHDYAPAVVKHAAKKARSAKRGAPAQASA